MISIFQIFRIVIGVIVFIFVITFFLRVAETYAYTQEMRIKIDTVNSFDHMAMAVHSSGNPATFPGFKDFETLVYEAPKVKSDAGHRTLSVPVFFMADKGGIAMERRCLDYGWFRHCSVLAFPTGTLFMFTLIDNKEASRELVRDIADSLPAGMEYGLCDGNDARVADKAQFLSYLGSSSGAAHEPCVASLPGTSVLVTVNATLDSAVHIDRHFVVDQGSGTVSGFDQGARLDPRSYMDALDISIFMTGHGPALDYKNQDFLEELETAAGIMHQRTVLVEQSVRGHNKQPCPECSTPIPEACGWTGYDGTGHPSQSYRTFIASLRALQTAMGSGPFEAQLLDTAQKYETLQDEGCE